MASYGYDSPEVRLNNSQANLLSNPDLNNRPLGPRQLPSTNPRSLVAQPRPPHNVFSDQYAGSSETLLSPPSYSTRAHRLRDEDSAPGTPTESSTRRNSLDSDGKATDARLIGADPFSDSRTPSRAGSPDDENVNTQTVSEKYNIMPSAGLLLYPEDVEKDDYLHNPDPNDKGDRDCNIFTRRGVVNIGGLALFTLGLLILFIGYPVLSVLRCCSLIHSANHILGLSCNDSLHLQTRAKRTRIASMLGRSHS